MPTVMIDERLAQRILEEIEGSEFRTVDDYVHFVLAEVLGMAAGASDDAVSKEIEESMKKLGYM